MAIASEFGCGQPVLTRSWAPDIGTGSGLGGASATFAVGRVPTPETALRRGRERVSNRRTLLRSPYFAVASWPWHSYAFRRRDPVQTLALQAQNSPFWRSLTPERLCAETASHYSSSVLQKLRANFHKISCTPVRRGGWGIRTAKSGALACIPRRSNIRDPEVKIGDLGGEPQL